MGEKVGTDRQIWNSVNLSMTGALEPEPRKQNLQYAKLKAIEKDRRDILKKVDHPPWKVMAQCKGTILPPLGFNVQMILNMSIYIIVRIVSRRNATIPDFIQGLKEGIDSNLNTIGSFLSFFLVFFVVQNNSRFTDMYDLCMSGKGQILSIASIARANISREQGLRMVRYLNAAYAAAFTGLSEAYTYDGYFLEVNKSLKLLNEAELERVAMCNMNQGGSCYREILQWVQIEITNAHREKVFDGQTAKLLRESVLNLQASMSKLYNYHDQPMIFFYIHFIVFVSFLYLPLFSVQAASEIPVDTHWSADAVAGIIVFLQTLFVIGLLQLGQKLSDPFGKDYEDLSVMHYINFTWRESGRILASKLPSKSLKPNANTTEEQLAIERSPIGEAWDFALETADHFEEEDFYDA